MIKRSKFLLCALASVGVITSFNTINANAMTNSKTTTGSSKYTVSQVEDLMYKLPYSIDLYKQGEIKSEIKEAVLAYNSLPADKQNCVDEYAISDLKHCVTLLKRIQSDEKKAMGLALVIDILDDAVGYNENTRTISNTDILRDNKKSIQKLAQRLEDTYEKLDYSIKYQTGISDYMTRLGVIENSLL